MWDTSRSWSPFLGRLQRITVIGDRSSAAAVRYRLVLDQVSEQVAQVFQGAVPVLEAAFREAVGESE